MTSSNSSQELEAVKDPQGRADIQTVKDLLPLTLKILEDGQWHPFAEFIKEVGGSIPFERAVRFYQGMGGGAKAATREGGDPRPVQEREWQGRRRCAYICIERLVNRGDAICKDKTPPPDQREYKIADKKPEEPKSKVEPKAEKPAEPKKPKAPAKPSRYAALIEVLANGDGRATNDGAGLNAILDEVQSSFTQYFPKCAGRDREDLYLHLRAARRIIACAAAEAVEKPETEVKPAAQTAPATTQ